MSLLNESLFMVLQKLFGEVRISNPGTPLRYRAIMNPLSNKPTIEVIDFGETYRICCPYCFERVGRPDRRFRLNINHRWGTFFPELGSRNFSLIRCFNEDCFSDFSIKQDFICKILKSERLNLSTDNLYIVEETTPQEIELPKCCIDIRELEAKHPARLYLASRKFDPDFVAEKYGCFFVEQPESELIYLYRRLVFPIYMQNKLLSYQARSIADTEPKYLSAKGTRIHNLLYGWDLVDGYNTAVLVEGIFDSLRFGPPALAIFGSTVSRAQARVLAQRFKNVILLLDGDLKGKPEISKNSRTLKAEGIEKVKVVQLPGKLDPADLDDKQLRKLRGALGI